MLAAFRDGRDIYQETAKALVGHEVDKDDPARAAAKRATLGFLYGLGEAKYRQNVYKDTGEKLTAQQAARDRQPSGRPSRRSTTGRNATAAVTSGSPAVSWVGGGMSLRRGTRGPGV
jgi:hypothetical protein